jgi:hypothetical protein
LVFSSLKLKRSRDYGREEPGMSLSNSLEMIDRRSLLVLSLLMLLLLMMRKIVEREVEKERGRKPLLRYFERVA